MADGSEVAAEHLARYRARHEREPQLGCDLTAHRDLGFCGYCSAGGLNTELMAWRLLAMAERGAPTH